MGGTLEHALFVKKKLTFEKEKIATLKFCFFGFLASTFVL
jgi:hypothetical protein